MCLYILEYREHVPIDFKQSSNCETCGWSSKDSKDNLINHSILGVRILSHIHMLFLQSLSGSGSQNSRPARNTQVWNILSFCKHAKYIQFWRIQLPFTNEFRFLRLQAPCLLLQPLGTKIDSGNWESHYHQLSSDIINYHLLKINC